MVVLDWNGTIIGVGTDRVGAIWISGAEIFRTSTPKTDNTSWHIEKEVSKYSSLLRSPGNLTSIVTAYSGQIKVVATLSFFETSQQYHEASAPNIIIPVSNHQGSPWFTISNSQSQGNTSVNFPSNVMNVTLEVYSTAHKCDEAWFDSYVVPVSRCSGNDAFREIQVFIDGNLSGIIWPFPIIYTGGINPNLWETIPALDSLDIPPAAVPLTPFSGKLANGKPHAFSFRVVGNQGYWLIDANILVGLDPNVGAITGELTQYDIPKDATRQASTSNDWFLSRTIIQDDNRSLTISGYANTSMGIIQTTVRQTMSMRNLQLATPTHLAESFSATGSVTTTITTTWMGATRNETDTVSYSVGLSQPLISSRGFLIIEVDQSIQHQNTLGLNGMSTTIMSSDQVNAHSNGQTSEDYRYADSFGVCYSHLVSTTHGSLTSDVVNTKCGAG